MYKVFIYNKPIYFIDDSEKKEKQSSENCYSFVNENDTKNILTIHRKSKSLTPLFVSYKNLDQLMKSFFVDYKKVEAAGGIVLNKNKEILFIDRLGYWDLPKGKVEKNEKLRTAAIREVEEECGISSPLIEKKLLKTLHTYNVNGKNYLKTTHWYLMTYDGNEKLIPQTDEGITAVKWVKKEKMEDQLSRTYTSILDVLNSYIE